MRWLLPLLLLAACTEPAPPETESVKALVSATGSAARVEKERSLLLWMREVVAILAYQIEIPHQHKVDISEALDRYQKALDAVEQQNDGAMPRRQTELK